MKRRGFDIDIDVPPNVDKGGIGVRQIIYDEDNKRIRPHPSGVIIEPVPVDAITGNSCIDYNDADALGIYSVDILTNTVYSSFKNKDEVLKYAEQEPNWDMLLDDEVIKQLPHVAGNADVLKRIAPRSVIELADVLALIRPSKMKFIDDYCKPSLRRSVRRSLYVPPKVGGIYFKKSHAIGYAVMIICVINKIRAMDAFLRYG